VARGCATTLKFPQAEDDGVTATLAGGRPATREIRAHDQELVGDFGNYRRLSCCSGRPNG